MNIGGRLLWVCAGLCLAVAVFGAVGLAQDSSSPTEGEGAESQELLSEQGQEPAAHIAHAMAMNGEPKYQAGFTHFDYVNPDAPKGGQMRGHSVGTFDSLNPFIATGVSASNLGLIFDPLTVKSNDEPFTEYGLIAEKIEWPEDRSWVIFHVNPAARFHDGHPVTAEDVAFTFELLSTQGSPVYAYYWGGVESVEVLDDYRIQFTFQEGDNRELPLILGQMSILPKHWWEGRDFTQPSLEPPLGSGPYRVAEVRPGHSITYERVEDYWAADHPVMRGQYNYDTVRIDYYRDSTVALEAFKSGEYDYRLEYTSKLWATGYDSPALDAGQIKMDVIEHQLTQGMQGFFFNLRREQFQDPLLREALAYAFDFEWSNRNLFYGQYTRTDSYFDNSELGSTGLPSPEELAYLEPLAEHLDPRVFTETYSPPATDGSGNIRGNLVQALELLKQAGWDLQGNKLVNASGEQLSFEILIQSQAMERVALPYASNLERLGVDVSVRLVDPTLYQNLLREFDFDVTVVVQAQSMSPGNEQYYFWHSSSRDAPGSRNYAGIDNPAIDKLVELVVEAPSREELVIRTRALDRALLWGHYVVPHWHYGAYRIAHWDIFSWPEQAAPYGMSMYTWWIDQDKLARLAEENQAFR
ncbi:MAG: ABC transporter substrate-binding protein [Desulfovibrio sp.]|nr:MAG: ABC transporter substrate-binding protein [Desulfovibrio sp.]